jgi:hypothetical protein
MSQNHPNSGPSASNTTGALDSVSEPLSRAAFFPPIYGPLPQWCEFESSSGVLKNTRIPARLPAGITPAPGEELDTTETDPVPDLSYDPYQDSERVLGIDVVADLWDGVWNGRPGGHIRDLTVCRLFDHVDFYRIVYITLVHQSSVLNENERLFWRFADILTKAGRPTGYMQTLYSRYPTRIGGEWNYDAEEISQLFKVLRMKNFVGGDRAFRGDKAFRRLMFWVQRRPKLSANVLNGLPEAILAIENESQKMGNAPYELKWDCYPRSFMYMDVNGST